MPEMMVCPVSWSFRMRKVGSSSESRTSASDILSVSALVLGSTATEMTGSGNVIDLQDDRDVGVAHGVTGEGVLETHDGDDVAG